MPRISGFARSKMTPEAVITRQVKDLLQYRGWRAIRFQRFVIPGAGSSGEPGCPDYLFLYYLPGGDGKVLALWVEFKSQRGRQSVEQQEWHKRESLRGGLVWTVSNLDEFERGYEAQFGWLHRGDTAVGQLSL